MSTWTTVHPKSEQEAWDEFACEALRAFLMASNVSHQDAPARAAEVADKMMLERRARQQEPNKENEQ